MIKNSINASEARKLSEESLNGPLIFGILDIAFRRIKEAASNGKFSVAYPFYNAYPAPSTEAAEAAIGYLKTLGYKVTHHPNPDPGDPRSSSYDEVSW